MAGHSRWAQVKHKKAGTDAKRGALFSKFGRLISAAAREGRDSPNANPTLRSAMEQARAAGMPKENIERAIARARGASEGDAVLTREYEAYGPGGSAFLIQAVTDNANRTTQEIKAILAEFGGKLAEAGSVAWLFERRVVAEFPGEDETVALTLIDAGAEDVRVEGGQYRALVAPGEFEAFQRAAAERGLTPAAIRFVAVPKNAAAPGPGDRERAEALTEALDDHADVTAVWTNIADAEVLGVSMNAGTDLSTFR